MTESGERTLERFALNQVQVVGLLQDTALESTAQTLQVATVNVEHVSRHLAGSQITRHCTHKNFLKSTE